MECGHDNPLSLGCSNHRRGVGIFLLVKNVPNSFPKWTFYIWCRCIYIYRVIFIYGRMYSISYSYVVRLNDLLIHYIASNFVISLFSLGFWTATPCCKDSDWTIFTRWNREGIKSMWWKHRRKHFTAALTGNTREEIVSIFLSRTWRVFVPKSKNMPSSGKVLRISMSNLGC